MKTRTDVLNHLARKHNLQRYLEIGVQVPELNFDKIQCESKLGVDPDPKAKALIGKTSDEFFKMWLGFGDRISIPRDDLKPVFGIPDGPPFRAPRFNVIEFDKEFDLIFIDGLHTAEQVRKDFENSLKILSPNGFIVLHDCNPEKEEHTTIPRPTPTGHWNGDVYKFVSRISLNEQYCTVDVDCGCGVWKNDPTKPVVISDHIPSWTEFVHQRNQYLKLIDWNEFLAL